jgi:molybdate transport system substrate-binding protein
MPLYIPYFQWYLNHPKALSFIFAFSLKKIEVDTKLDRAGRLNFMKTVIVLSALLAVYAGVNGVPAADDRSQRILVFSAASTISAMNDIGGLFNKKGVGKCVISFASSSTLAKQIERGAPADVFVSANVKWVDYLAERGLIEPGSRFDLLGNRIVLIAPLDSPVQIQIEPHFRLAELLGHDRLAMGDPDHVPAGIYGKQALESLGLWKSVERRLARAKDVRAALALVEKGEAPLGVVYATDAGMSSKVRIVDLFPENTHPRITYPVVIVSGRGRALTEDFLAFLKSPEARVVFEKYGFTVW